VEQYVAPGAHALVFTHSPTGTLRELRIILRAGENRRIEPPPVVDSSPPSRAPKHRIAHTGVPPATWVAFGIAGVAAGTTAVFGGLAVRSKSAFDEGDRTDARADEVDRYRALTNVALGAAVVAALAGVVAWITSPPSK
jgi:hypothetical protein